MSIDLAYIELLSFKDYLEKTMKNLKRNTPAYMVQKANLKKVNNILQKCKESMNLKGGK